MKCRACLFSSQVLQSRLRGCLLLGAACKAVESLHLGLRLVQRKADKRRSSAVSVSCDLLAACQVQALGAALGARSEFTAGIVAWTAAPNLRPRMHPSGRSGMVPGEKPAHLPSGQYAHRGLWDCFPTVWAVPMRQCELHLPLTRLLGSCANRARS